MGSGLSMTSVNKIKELATAREYSLALEIIDSQDLSKSLNPQFIRLCGDVYIANKRYRDARKILLMAHKMAPEAKRVIYSLVDLYLRMGYKELADFYYSLYMFDAEPNLPQTNQINYIYSKAQGCPYQEIETLLFPMYSDVMDYEWSYELFLLMKIQGKDEVAEAIKADYIATYKNEPNVILMEEAEQSVDRLEELFYIYPKDSVADVLPEEEELREEEKPLMEADDLRMNPKEAEIQIVFDDNEKASFGAKLKYKRHIKEQEKLAKKEKVEGDETVFDSSEQETELEGESTEAEGSADAIAEDNHQEPEAIENKKSIFKKIFSRKKNDTEDIESEETDNMVETETQEGSSQDFETKESQSQDSDLEESESEEPEFEVLEEIEDVEVVDIVHTDTEEADSEENKLEVDELVEDAMAKSEVLDSKTETPCVIETDSEELIFEESKVSGNEEVEAATEDESEQENTEDIGDSVMQEIYEKKKISIVTELGEDTFVNTHEFEHGESLENPFAEMLNQDKNSTDSEVKSSFEFEEVQLQPEDDSEFEVDDFTTDFVVKAFDDEIQDDMVVSEVSDIADETETVEEEYVDIETTDEPEITEVTETVEEEYADIEATDEPEITEVTEAVEEEYADIEATDEPEITEVTEAVEEEYADIEATDEPEITEQIEAVEETCDYDNVEDNRQISLEQESVYDTLQEIGRLDFPEFRSTLFPEYGQKVVEVENNFNEIMSEAQDKINENLLKEEQMQREAEALLASLGIDLGSIKSTVSPSVAQPESRAYNATAYENVDTEVEKTPQIADAIAPEQIQEASNNYSPSRDELKASLKIDSVKKDILKQIKEYR